MILLMYLVAWGGIELPRRSASQAALRIRTLDFLHFLPQSRDSTPRHPPAPSKKTSASGWYQHSAKPRSQAGVCPGLQLDSVATSHQPPPAAAQSTRARRVVHPAWPLRPECKPTKQQWTCSTRRIPTLTDVQRLVRRID